MNQPLQSKFELYIKALTSFPFQRFVIEVFRYHYGVSNFTDLRPQKDKGCDGIVIQENRIIACYGPKENMNAKRRQSDFKNKIQDDHSSYVKFWANEYPNWSFVINHNIDPEYVAIANRLPVKSADTVVLIGASQIVSIIAGLKNFQQRKLGEMLGIEKELFASDVVGEILYDLLQGGSVTGTTNYNPKTLVEITEKIRINFNGPDIDIIKAQYSEYLIDGTFVIVNGLLNGYEDEEIKKIKHRVIYSFSNVTGDFKSRLNHVTENLLNKYSASTDDTYLYYIRAVLIYLFEQCVIGAKSFTEL